MKMNKLTELDILNCDIEALRAEAATAGDFEMVDLCERALEDTSDREANDAVLDAINRARMMQD